MSNRSRSGAIWIAIAKVAGFFALFTWFGFVAADLHFDATRPIKPDSSKGAVIPHNNHGHIVYLTEHEREQLLALQRVPIGFFLVATVAAYLYKKTTGKLPN
jgi:hypothetical protein